MPRVSTTATETVEEQKDKSNNKKTEIIPIPPHKPTYRTALFGYPEHSKDPNRPSRKPIKDKENDDLQFHLEGFTRSVRALS